MERDFEDEFFIECEVGELENFYANREAKVDRIRMMGKIIDHMESDEVEFADPYAEGAAIMIRGMARYMDDHADLPTYVKKGTRTGRTSIGFFVNHRSLKG